MLKYIFILFLNGWYLNSNTKSLFAGTAEINFIPPKVVLTGSKGGLVAGGSFDTSTMKNSVHVIFYVDPDAKDQNEPTEIALKAASHLKDRFVSVAIINMKATSIPNFLLSALIADKQKEYPNTIYVEDLEKVFVKEWGLQDDSTQVLVMDKSGQIIFNRSGLLNEGDLSLLVKTIEGAL